MDIQTMIDNLLSTYGNVMTRNEREYILANRHHTHEDQVALDFQRVGAVKGRRENPMPVLYGLFMNHHLGDKAAAADFHAYAATIDLMLLDDRVIVGGWRASFAAGDYLDYVN